MRRLAWPGATPGVRWWAVAGATALLLGVAVAGGEASATAARALAVVAVLGAAVWALRARRQGGPPPCAIRVAERHLLARDTGVALVSIRGRSLVIGFGAAGVSLLADLGAPSAGEAP